MKTHDRIIRGMAKLEIMYLDLRRTVSDEVKEQAEHFESCQEVATVRHVYWHLAPVETPCEHVEHKGWTVV